MRKTFLLLSLSLSWGIASQSFGQEVDRSLTARSAVLRSELVAEVPASDHGELPTDVSGWTTRLRNAAHIRSYVGTLVVTTDAGQVSGSRVWHACRDDRQIERVDALDGPARTVFRRGGDMRTFLRASHKVLNEPVTASSVFPQPLQGLPEKLNMLYRVERKGTERVAGHESDVIWLVPRDALRFGYRVWSERRSGLVLKVQTVQADGRVLEQAGFLQLDLDAPVSFDQLSSAMDDVSGYQVVDSVGEEDRTEQNSKWVLRTAVPGFRLEGCRMAFAGARTTQCSYADGLTRVSLFFEDLGPNGPPAAVARWSAGATRAIARPLDASTWLTVVGEVPYPTLLLFAERLQRRSD